MPLRTPQRIGTWRTAIAAALLALGATLVTPMPSAAHAATVTDYCAGQCADILPPGENGNATLTDILGNKVLGTRPANTMDQLGPYSSLATGYSTLSDATITSFFNNASFGVPSDQVASVTTPRSDVTITRDKSGIPHITGTTRSGTEYGAGYAAAQDRLWLMDLFRHVGRGQLSSFAGGAAANRELEQEFYSQAPYTEADLQAQVDQLANNNGTRGQQALADAQAYVDGINAYITASISARNFPGEYVLTGHMDAITNAGTIAPFKLTDLIALASVIGALFGTGGGGEVQSALSLEAAQQQYGVTQGTAVWESFRERDDPEATSTINTGATFPYATKPANPVGEALPDAGTVVAEPLIYDATGGATQATTASQGVLPADLLTNPQKGMSNALVVSGSRTASGHPIAVFGPQTGYFPPQLLMLQEIQGPGLSARGASFAGLSFYVQIGRGQDYSWSATTSGQDITDTYAVELCQDDYHYLYHGVCTAMDKVEQTNSWVPSTADPTAAGSYRMQVYRTKYGPVEYRATVGGKKVAYTTLRSSYMHEADSIIVFQMFNDPDYVSSPATFQSAVQNINYTFNWFYADSTHTAYYNSGDNPVRATGVDAEFPVWAQAAYEWQGWNPATNTATYTPASAHPNSIDQDYYISWNNKLAKDYTMASWGDGSVHRGTLLDDRVQKLVAAGGVTRTSLTKAMADAALTDLRAEDVLPDLLEVLNSQPVTDPTAAAAVTKLSAWVAAGSKRTETSAGSKTYANADAIRILDAWWPLLVNAEFEPGLGSDLYTAITANLPIDESPSAAHGPTGSHAGSSFQYGWWSYVDKDVRAVLGETVQGGLAQKYCGGGTLTGCRDVLISTLKTAAGKTAAQVYPGDDLCAAGNQWCADSIVQRMLGGIKHDNISWQNRPTYQQVVEYTSHR